MVGVALLILLANASDAEVLGQAEAAFRKGVESREDPSAARAAFRDAARHYEELARRGFRNPALYFNLGNAHLLADDLPRAILSYRRGLLLSPNDSTLRDGLGGARERVVYPVGDFGRPPRDLLPAWVPRVTSGPVLFAAIIGHVTFCVALTRWWMVRRGRPLVVAMLSLGLTLLLAAGWGFLYWRELEEDRYPFVVVAEDNVVLRTGNGLSYPAKYEAPLNRGVEGRLLFRRGDWMKVELAGGESGWLRRDWVLVSREE